MDLVFKALADAPRRRLRDWLHARNGQTLSGLCDGLAMSRQAVSKHLAPPEAANRVATARHGRQKLHSLNPVPIHDVAARRIGKFERQRRQAVADLRRGLEAARDPGDDEG
ncbi:ArsR/SmtB family transcription factor [Burkholderia seminalis]|uniref:ArsR/SmtB family transcription factor n=1 Tax=Burkholderia seminalis TaxID=488731 RepID=UPI00158F45D0|nr:helix-turn-helix transcriptional regulator [Burkholderia seminalis]